MGEDGDYFKVRLYLSRRQCEVSFVGLLLFVSLQTWMNTLEKSIRLTYDALVHQVVLMPYDQQILSPFALLSAKV